MSQISEKNMAAKIARFFAAENIDECLDDLASDFEVYNTFDESDDEGKCILLFK